MGYVLNNVLLKKASTRVLKTIDCAHCSRVSLEITATGKMLWTSHDHPNVTMIDDLINFYFQEIANAPTLKDLRRVIDERLEALAA